MKYGAIQLNGEQVVHVFDTQDEAHTFFIIVAQREFDNRPDVCKEATLEDYLREWFVFPVVVHK